MPEKDALIIFIRAQQSLCLFTQGYYFAPLVWEEATVPELIRYRDFLREVLSHDF